MSYYTRQAETPRKDSTRWQYCPREKAIVLANRVKESQHGQADKERKYRCCVCREVHP